LKGQERKKGRGDTNFMIKDADQTNRAAVEAVEANVMPTQVQSIKRDKMSFERTRATSFIIWRHSSQSINNFFFPPVSLRASVREE
jgi:hypothetical protein